MMAPTKHPRRGLAILLGVLVGVYLVEIQHGLPNRDIVWGYEANPLLPLIAAKKIFLDGWNTGWHMQQPPFHQFVLLLLLTPYMTVQWLLGNLAGLRMEGGYPYGLANFDTLFMHVAVITRLVSVAMALAATYWIYRIGEIVHSARAGLYAACIIGFSPAVVYYVHTETVDVPLLFWLSSALYCYVRALQTSGMRYFVLLAITAAAAASTSIYGYGAVVVLPIPLLASLARSVYGALSSASLVRAAFDARYVVLFVSFVIAYAIAQNWVWNFAGFVEHIKLTMGLAALPADLIYSHVGVPTLPMTRSPVSVLILGFVLGWAGFTVSLSGLFSMSLRESPLACALLWPAAGCIVFTVWPALALISFVERAFLPLGLVIAVPGGILLSRLWGSPRIVLRAVPSAVVAVIALNGIAMAAALMNDPRYQAERYLSERVRSGAKVELYGFRSELPRVEAQWRSVVINVLAAPYSDRKLTDEFVNAESLARRQPEWIVLSQAFMSANASARGTEAGRLTREFLRRLDDGTLGYVRLTRFESSLTERFRFPTRLTPPVTVFKRRDDAP